MDFDLTMVCSVCGGSMDTKDDISCDDCIQQLKDKITELENRVYDLEKYIEKEEL